MKEIVFNKCNYKSYKDMYHDICVKLDKDRFIDWQDDYNDLEYNGNLLSEFLWYCHNDNVKYIFVNFDKAKIKLEKSFDDYQYAIIFRVFERFVKQYSNNQLEFRMEEEKK